MYEDQGLRVVYFHAVEFSLANRLFRLWRGLKQFESGQDRAVTRASLFSVLLREKFLFFDLLRFRFYRWRLQHARTDILLSDRFFYDSLINIASLSDHILVRFGLRLLERFLPRVDHAFYIDTPPEVIMARARVPEQGLDYLVRKEELFRKNVSTWGLVHINGNQPKEKVLADLLAALDALSDHTV